MHAYNDAWHPPTETPQPFSPGPAPAPAIALAGGADGPAGGPASGSDLLAFLNDFRAARYEPVPSAGADIDLTAGATPAATAAGAAGGPYADAGSDPYADPYADPYSDPYEGRIAPGGPGWWQASDHRWYPPELHPDYQAAPVEAQAEAPAPAAVPAAVGVAVPAAPGAPATEAAAPDGDDAGSARGRLRLGRLGRR